MIRKKSIIQGCFVTYIFCQTTVHRRHLAKTLLPNKNELILKSGVKNDIDIS